MCLKPTFHFAREDCAAVDHCGDAIELQRASQWRGSARSGKSGEERHDGCANGLREGSCQLLLTLAMVQSESVPVARDWTRPPLSVVALAPRTDP